MTTENTAARFVSMELIAANKPRWADWLKAQHCAVWQATALACDVDPTRYAPDGFTAYTPTDGTPDAIPSAVQQLSALVVSAIGSGALKVRRSPGRDLMCSEVDLSDFASWLNLVSHSVPKEFPWTSRPLEVGSYTWPWGRHQTQSLRMLALAADKFWKNYDPSDFSTAPKSEAVIDWLQQQGATRRKAEAIASLLRPDDLPTGPR